MPATVIITTGEPGSGKTLARGPVFMLREFLPTRHGIHYSNLPLHPERIATTYAAMLRRSFIWRWSAKHPVHYWARMQRIPEDELRRWMDDQKAEIEQAEERAKETGHSVDYAALLHGPWNYFTGERSIRGAHIAIDEAHHYIPRTGHVAKRKLWRAWLGELRHLGATCEFITQNLDNLDENIRQIAGDWLQVTKLDSEKVPFLGIPLGDLWELKAAITGEWTPYCKQQTQRRDGRGWRKVDTTLCPMTPANYALYDSYSAPQRSDGQHESGAGVQHKHQVLGRWGTLKWFVWAHGWRFVLAVLVGCGVFWLTLGGGMVYGVQGFMWYTQSIANANRVDKGEAETAEASAASDDAQSVAVALVSAPAGVEGQGFDPGAPNFVPPQYDFQGNPTGAGVTTNAPDEKLGDVAVLTPKLAIMRDGSRVALYGNIPSGDWKGYTIQRIDLPGRGVVLNDGTWLFTYRKVDPAEF
jgi:hypothetical protein